MVILWKWKTQEECPDSHLSNENFVGERAVNVRSVEESDASGDGMVDERYHFMVGLWRAIEGRHAHATQPLR